MRHASLGKCKRTAAIDFGDEVVLGDWGIDHLLPPQCRSVVDENDPGVVGPLFYCSFYALLGSAGVAQVDLERQRIAASLVANFLGHTENCVRQRRLRLNSLGCNDDVTPTLCKRKGADAANAPRGTGDDGDLAFEVRGKVGESRHDDEHWSHARSTSEG